jgi:hypothetical protein
MEKRELKIQLAGYNRNGYVVINVNIKGNKFELLFLNVGGMVK